LRENRPIAIHPAQKYENRSKNLAHNWKEPNSKTDFFLGYEEWLGRIGRRDFTVLKALLLSLGITQLQ